MAHARALPYKQRHRRIRLRHVLYVLLVLIAIGLIAARIYLSYWAVGYVNRTLDSIPGYAGSVRDVDIHLYRGAYTIHDLKLSKLRANMPEPFISIVQSDLSIQWGALLRGRIVSDVHLTKPHITFAVNPSGTTMQTGEEVNWSKYIDKLMPIDINLIEIINGKLAYKDFSTKPQVNIDIDSMNGELRNLRNVDDKNVALPSSLTLRGTSIGKGKFDLTGRMNVLRAFPDMDMDLKLENVSLPALNSYSSAYALIDFAKGNLSIYSEFAIKNGNLTGYIKPIATDIQVVDLKQDTNPIEIAWETLASFVIELFENQPRDQFATKIALEGRIDEVKTNGWSAFVGIVRNAFFKAFEKGTEGEQLFK